MTPSGLTDRTVVDRDTWLLARKALLAREKELTRLKDQVAQERRALPWVRMDKDYVFATPEGPRALADLFDGRRQLLVQHFMFPPDWAQGCPSCSYMADHLDAMTVHLAQRDTSVLVVSRATLAQIEAFQQRMGWRFRWASSAGTEFNRDFGVTFDPAGPARGPVEYNYRVTDFPGSEMPGISVFYRDESGAVFHTYSTYGRGLEVMMGTYALLDLTPEGRHETHPDHPMDWVRHHDRYATSGTCCGHGQA